MSSEFHLPMSSYNSNNMISLHNSSLGYWDQYFHSLGVLNTEAMSLVMDHHGNNSTPFISGNHHDDISTGYLEDALLEFSTEGSKRRRLLLFGDDEELTTRDSNFASDHNMNSSNWELSKSFGFLSQMTTGFNENSDGTVTTSFCSIGEVKTAEEEKSVSEPLDSSASSSSLYKDCANNKSVMSHNETLFSDPLGGCDEKIEKKNVAPLIRRVVYPFAVVKPGGREGDLTLNDINERILMPPTRPVRHPVGAFACRPTCLSPHGPGLSGKAVVAFTRIHTRGRGTITIIRTKG